MHDGGECGSSDANLPSSDSVEECAAHCAAANGCEFFSYNAGNNYCFHEYTASRDCPEGFEVDSYDFYALVRAGFSPSPSPPLDSSPPASLSHVLVQEQKECDDDGETDHGYYLTLQECADECAATTGCVNFIYARIGAGRCSGTNCKCFTVRATAPLRPPRLLTHTSRAARPASALWRTPHAHATALSRTRTAPDHRCVRAHRRTRVVWTARTL